MNAMKKILGMLLFGMLLLTAVPNEAQAQCPMCKAAVESNQGDEPSALAGGLNTGIIYLFALPYVTFAVVGFFYYRGYRRRKQKELAQQLASEQVSELPDALNPNPQDSDGN